MGKLIGSGFACAPDKDSGVEGRRRERCWSDAEEKAYKRGISIDSRRQRM